MKTHKYQIIKLLLFVIVLVFAVNGYSQGLRISANLDKDQVEIGEKAQLTLEVKQANGVDIRFPELFLGDTIAKDLEIVNVFSIDTVKLDDNSFLRILKLDFQVFQYGEIPIAPFVFLYVEADRVDTLRSNSLLIRSYLQMDSTMVSKIDTTQMHRIFDIKTPYEAPFTFEEFFHRFGMWLFIIPILIIIMGLIIYFVKRKKANKPFFTAFVKPKEPAHIIAYRDLEKLEKEKLWQNDKIKEYHSQLTDIMRVYVNDRFDVPTMERTSHEIIQSFEQNKLLDSNTFGLLKQMLTTAHFVKFAKAKPSADDNEQSLKNAYDFVKFTRQSIREEMDKPKENEKLEMNNEK